MSRPTRQARQAAEAELVAARRHAGEVGRRVEQARKRQEVLRHRVRRLDEELDQLRAEEAEAGEGVAVAAGDRRAADERLAHAEEVLQRMPPAP